MKLRECADVVQPMTPESINSKQDLLVPSGSLTLWAENWTPFNQLQIEHGDGVDYGNQQQGNERCGGQTADLGVTHRFQERTAMSGEGEQMRSQ